MTAAYALDTSQSDDQQSEEEVQECIGNSINRSSKYPNQEKPEESNDA